MEFCFPDRTWCYGMGLSFASTLLCPAQQLLYLFYQLVACVGGVIRIKFGPEQAPGDCEMNLGNGR